MAKVIVMDATRSECIEAIRQNKMKKSTYGSEGFPLHECGSDMGYYVQIQEPGGLETRIIEGSKSSTKTKSYAWGRVWYKGSYLKQFSGPINVVRQDIVKYLQQLTTDSHPLKTYKIKNHDSGKTYSVKAVSYTDAKMKYNAHISDALPLVERIGDYEIRKNDDDDLKFAVFYKGQIIAETTTINVAKKEIESHKNDIAKKNDKYNLRRDALTEDEWQYVYYKSKEERELRNLCSKHNVKFGPYVLDKDGFYKARIEGDFDDVHKVNNLWKNYQFNGVLEDSITEDAYVYPTHASTNMAASFAKLCVEKFGGKVGSKGGNKYVYIAQDKETANKAKQFLEEKYKTSLPTVEFIVADSITEDGYNEMQTQAKQLAEKLKIKTSLGISTNTQTKVVMFFAYSVEQAERWVDKLKTAGYKAELHRESGNVIVAKFIMPELKTDSITEDADAFIKETIAELSRYIRNWDFMSAKERNNIMPGYSKSEGLAGLKIKLANAQAMLKDSITEDADKSMGTYNGYSIKQNIDGDIYVLKKSGEKQFFESWKKAHEAIKTGAIKDSLTEDAGEHIVDSFLKDGLLKVTDFVNEVDNSSKDYTSKTVRFVGGGGVTVTVTDLTRIYVTDLNTNKTVLFAKLKTNPTNKYDWRWELRYTLLDLESIIARGNYMKELKFKDSLTEDADIAQNDIKSSYLPEDANADNIQYLGFNEKRKLSFYSYGDRYFVHHDLEGRTEEIDKETVQKILKKNILGEIDENDLINKEPQSEEIVSDSFEDAGEITLEQFDPKRLVESSKSRKQALHNEIKMKNGDVYTVFFQASGEVEKPRSIWVSIVLEKPSGQQSRVLTEEAETYEQAIQIMNDWKKKQERGDK